MKMGYQYDNVGGVIREAQLDPMGLYRWSLTRTWRTQVKAQRAIFIMLNPSTADGRDDDPTIRRCIGFAEREGCGSLAVVNLYAYRATRPLHLWQAEANGIDVVGDGTDGWISGHLAGSTGPVIAAWGAQGKPDRINQVIDLVHAAGRELHCLGTSKQGMPRHPLYLLRDTPMEPYVWPRP